MITSLRLRKLLARVARLVRPLRFLRRGRGVVEAAVGGGCGCVWLRVVGGGLGSALLAAFRAFPEDCFATS